MSDTLASRLSQFDPDLPLDRAATIPSSWYFDSEVYSAERRSVFGNSWQVVGRAEQVSQPGSFVTADIAGEPIVVLRDLEGVLRGFYNVCRHRAACVAHEPAGQATRLRCRYHGWTYDLSGKLIGTPEFQGVSGFCHGDHGLVPVAVDTWGKWVWVHLGAQPGLLREWLLPLSEQADVLNLDEVQFVQRREYELNCNWKVFVDNYLDGGYHVNTIHTGLASVINYSQYRTHVHGNTAVQTCPVEGASSDGGNDQQCDSSAEACAPTSGTPRDSSGGSIAEVRPESTAYYWWAFPNFMINAYTDGEGANPIVDTNLVLPLGMNRCRVIFDFYFARPDRLGADFMSASIAVADRIQREDMEICEEVQRGLRSRSFSTGRFSVRREIAGHHFHRLLAQHLARDLAAHRD